MRNHTRLPAAALLLALTGGMALAYAADDHKTNPANDAPAIGDAVRDNAAIDSATVDTSSTYRASVLMNMPVHNAQGEQLGSINDFVIDLTTGSVRYAAISFGGFLGFGDKLFAVPMKAMTLRHDGNNASYFVLNVPKERLEKAPGFNRDAWPAFGDPIWSNEIDRYYETDLPHVSLND